jgi:ABC-type polar amino acid transport system ATPase subunit
MVFQEFNLWPNLTLFDNIAAPLKWSLRLSSEEIQARVEECASLVQIKDILHKYPYEASGGQKQRTGIARALVVRPHTLLLDEITSALDPELVSGILECIKQLRERGYTMIIITHHMLFAKQVADRVAFLNNGKIHEIGPTNIIFKHPNTQELYEFLSHFVSL